MVTFITVIKTAQYWHKYIYININGAEYKVQNEMFPWYL